jgi:hypothetical protein
MKTLRWLIVFVAAAVVAYLLLSRPGARADRTTHIVVDPPVAENARVLLDGTCGVEHRGRAPRGESPDDWTEALRPCAGNTPGSGIVLQKESLTVPNRTAARRSIARY